MRHKRQTVKASTLRFTEIREVPEEIPKEKLLVRQAILKSLGKNMRGHHSLACYAAYTVIPKEEDHDQESV